MTTTIRRARLTVSALLVALALPLSGCIAMSIPDQPAAHTEPPVATEETSEPTPQQTVAPEAHSTMTFEDGANLGADSFVQWGDGLMFDDGWAVSSPDNGQGQWAYGSADGACNASFYQGIETSLIGSENDYEATVSALVMLLESDRATVEEHMSEGTFSFQAPGAREAAHLSVDGEDEYGPWNLAVRAFAQTGAVLYVNMACADGSIDERTDEVYNKNLVSID